MRAPSALGAAAIALTIVGLAGGCFDSGETRPAPAVPAAPAEIAQTQGPEKAPASAEAAPAALPEAEVSRTAIAAETRLRAIRSLAGRTLETNAIAASSRSVLDSVERLKEWMRSRDPRQQTSRALRSLDQEWRLDGRSLEAWMETTGRRLDSLSSARAELRGLEETWSATLEKLAADVAAPEIRDRAKGVLDSVREADVRLRSEIDSVLLLESRLSAATLDVEDALDSIAAALREERKKLFEIESPAIWKTLGAAAGRPPLSDEVAAAFRESARALRHYVDRAGSNLRLQLSLFIALAVAFFSLRRRSRAWPQDSKGPLACARLVRRPILGAWLVALLGGPWIHPRAPLAFYELSAILLVVPVVALMRGIVQPRVRGALYSLAAIFVAERLWESTGVGTLLERFVLLGLTALSAVVLAWAILPPSTLPGIVAGRWWRAATVAGRIGLAALAVSLLANVFGNVTLARLLTATVVRAAYWAVVLYAGALLLRGAVALLLRSPAVRPFRVIEQHGDLILRRASLVIDVLAVFFFLLVTLSAADLWPVARGAVQDVLSARWGIGDFRFSLASALVFLAAVYASVLVSRVIRAVLEADVYPRVALPRGVSSTLTMLVRYSVISIGFFLAASIAGIPLDRLAIILGAFSVGIGFGLQTVVNNFVSGLILMFERPIQIGDAVEMSGLVGRVRRIGVRASTIETFEGAEVIVPNGTLVSSHLINWTLSSRNRRIEIQVGVAYATDPEKVLTLLRDTVRGHPGVLAEPEPTALFRGFGPSSLDFSLLFWTADFDGWIRIRSEVTVKINRALREAGIEIPFPQHDVRLRR